MKKCKQGEKGRFAAIPLFGSNAILCLLSLGLATQLHAATYYVAPNGSDANPGSITLPYGTIGKAASVAVAGDTILLRGGSYSQAVSISRSGAANNPLTIAGYPGESAVIDGKGTLPSGTYGVLFTIGANYVTLQDLTIQNSYGLGLMVQGSNNRVLRVKSYRNNENGILITGGSNNVVEDCEVYYNAKRNEFGNSPTGYWAGGLNIARNGVQNTIARRNKVWNNWGEGLSTFESTYTTLEDNQVWDNWAANVYLSDTQHDLVQRNLLYMTQGSPVSGTRGAQVNFMMGDEVYRPASSDNTIINNLVMGGNRTFYWWMGSNGGGLVNTLIANNTFVNATSTVGFQISSGSHSNLRVINNIVVQEGSLPIAYLPSSGTGVTIANNLWSKTPAASPGRTGDIIADPLLLRTGSTGAGALSPDWFKLNASSPAIGKGLTLPEVSEDYFRAARGSATDIGAVEYGNGGSLPAASAPTISPNGGTSSGPVQVTLTSATAGATIRYSLDGSTPSTAYSGPITISATTTVKAQASAPGYTDSTVASATFTVSATPQANAPAISPNGGNYTGSVSITLASTTPGATLRYSLDGSAPSTVYSGPITISATTTVKAQASAPGYADSSIASATFTVGSNAQASAPVISPGGGSYAGSVNVSLSSTTAGATIRYSLDGSAPSTVYSGPITLTSSAMLRAQASAPGFTDSAITAATFTITSRSTTDTATPTITITSPANYSTLQSGNNLLQVSVQDDVGVVGVQYVIDDRVVADVTSAPFSYNWNATAGWHYFTAVARDASGKRGVAAYVVVRVQ